MIAFVISYNQLTYTKQMALWLAQFEELEVVIVDNCSSYEPLHWWLDRCPFEVFYAGKNYGSRVVWKSGVLDEFVKPGHRYIVTDPDLDPSELPNDWLDVLEEGLNRHDFATKAGVGLEINDLPQTPITQRVVKWEEAHWAYPLDDMYYKASTSTTLCLCRTREHEFPSVRTGHPYVVRHLPWYYRSAAEIPEDVLYYMRTADPVKWNYWTAMQREEFRL